MIMAPGREAIKSTPAVPVSVACCPRLALPTFKYRVGISYGGTCIRSLVKLSGKRHEFEDAERGKDQSISKSVWRHTVE